VPDATGRNGCGDQVIAEAPFAGTTLATGEAMTTRRALKIVVGIAVLGLAFSGFLSYQEVFGHAVAACPSPGKPGTVLGYPACVYGFFMYLVITTVALWGLLSGRPAGLSRQDGAWVTAPRKPLES
jgi:uncharacterized membrane protein